MEEKYMKRAFELAKKGEGRVNPNPLVGAVIVKDGKIIGEGWHKKYGEKHAEAEAFDDAERRGENVEGADMYVTLEPCAHYGKQPPCANAIVEKKIKRVFVGITDPNEKVGGKGIKILKDAGIEVYTGFLEKELKEQNEIFLKYITSKEPFVLMKWAMTLDGKIASFGGDSKWVSCEKSREEVQHLRNKYMAIMVGINTVLQDNPRLTCRMEKGRNPIRIIVDSKLRIPIDAEVLKLEDNDRCIIATLSKEKEKIEKLKNKGAEVWVFENEKSEVPLKALIKKLGEENIDSILLEGGGSLNYSALKDGIVDKVSVFVAPKIIGGKDAKTPVEGEGIELMKDAVKIKNLKTELIGEDILISGYIDKEVKDVYGNS